MNGFIAGNGQNAKSILRFLPQIGGSARQGEGVAFGSSARWLASDPTCALLTSMDVHAPVLDPVSPVDLIAHAAAQFTARPSWDEYFMATAVLLSTRSPCERLHVGCVIVSGGDRKNRIVAAGYNGFLPGAPHFSRIREGHEQATVHAEQNAVADAARRGSSVEGCVAYVTHFPCINCAKILASAGIAEVRYRVDYHNDPLVEPLLVEAGLKLTKLESFPTRTPADSGTLRGGNSASAP